jgi:tetratricopeptide (TPR) repeat protein
VVAAVREQRNDLEGAVAAYRKVLAQHPPDVDALRELVIDHLVEIGDVASARAELDAKPVSATSSPKARLQEATVLRLEGNLDESLKTVERLLDEEAQLAPARLLRGILFLEQGEPDLAIADLDWVTDREPYNDEAHYRLGLAYTRTQQSERANVHLSESRRIFELRQQAVALHQRAIAEPNNAGVQAELARVYEAIGRDDLAATYRRASQNARSFPAPQGR